MVPDLLEEKGRARKHGAGVSVRLMKRNRGKTGVNKLKDNIKVNKGSNLLTCIPQIRTPSVLLVEVSHFFLWLLFFDLVASTPYCLVPIFKSSTHELFNRPVRSSIRMKCSCLEITGGNCGWACACVDVDNAGANFPNEGVIVPAEMVVDEDGK